MAINYDYQFIKEQLDKIEKWLRDQGLAAKYEAAGVYSISINSTLVYIGKSLNMLRRIANHIFEIQNKEPTANKYKVLHEAGLRGYQIAFDVMYYTKRKTEEAIKKDIGNKEGELIRKHLPPLNMQIPKEEDFHKSTYNKKAKTITLEEII